MKQVVRCFLKNNEGKYLLVKHIQGTHWTLPGGHIDQGETIHEALHREIMEEFNLQIEILSQKYSPYNKSNINIEIPGPTPNYFLENIKEKSLPLSIYEIEYESQKWGIVKKQEYIFLAQIIGGDIKVQEEEIAEYKWFTKEEILSEESTFEQIKEILKNI